MKNYSQNIPKSKKVDFQNKKKNISSENENKINAISSLQKSDGKKDFYKNETNKEIKDNYLRLNYDNDIKISSNPPNNINLISQKDDKNNEAENSEKNIIKLQKDDNKININNNVQKNNQPQIINLFINENKNNILENSAPPKMNLTSFSFSDNINNQLKERDKKLKNSLQAYKNINKKNDNISLNTLYKVRSILLNLLKDKEQDLEYSKFITEKKLKYMMKNKEKSENKIKVLESELKVVETRIEELEKILGEIYIFYDEEELKEDIKRFENSNEVKSGKFSKTLEQLETMKKMLPFVSEYGKVKDKKHKILSEKKELEKIIKNSGQTISILNNYYKNIKKKINEQIDS